WIFDLHEEDVYWCTADIGWVTGHSYIVYGPLANGATSVMYEGTPDHPDKDRFWRIVEKYGITIIYTAPTAIRTFMKWGEEYPRRRSSTRRATRRSRATSSSRSPGRRCCAASGVTPIATSSSTGRSTTISISPATAPSATRTATSGCSAAWTTS